MRKVGLMALLCAAMLAAGCGGSTKTVTVTGPTKTVTARGATQSVTGRGPTKTGTVRGSTTSPTSSASASGPVGGSAATSRAGGPSAVAACFKAGGAKVVQGPKPAGRGTAVYAGMWDGTELGFVIAPRTTVAARLQRTFAAAGGHIEPLTHDPAAFAFYHGAPTSSEAALLSKCTG